MNNCKKENDPLKTENKQANNLFNKCICYEFFHNGIRNKIRYILREITKEGMFNPPTNIDSNRNSHSNLNEKENGNNYGAYSHSKDNLSIKKNSFNIYINTQEDDLRRHSESRKFKENIDINIKNILKKNLTSARKDRIVHLYTEGSSDNKDKNANNFLKSNTLKSSNGSKSINKTSLNNYFISEKNPKTKINLSKNLFKPQENNNKEKKNLNEDSKGFSNENNLFNKKISFNNKSFLNTDGNNTNGKNIDLNKFSSTNSNNSNNRLNAQPNMSISSPERVIFNTENNFCNYESGENLKFENGNNTYHEIDQPEFSQASNTNLKGIENKKLGNKNLSKNPNISIYNNYMFSCNKKDKSINNVSTNKCKNTSECVNNILNSKSISKVNNNLTSYVSPYNYNSSLSLNGYLTQKQYSSQENYYNKAALKTEGYDGTNNKAKRSNSSRKFDSQENLETNANSKNYSSNKNDNVNSKNQDNNENINGNNNVNIRNHNFPKHYFSIGYIFIILACKSIKLKIFEYIDNFTYSNMEEIKKYKLKKCCLLHFLISCEEGLGINKKLSIENFINTSYSEDFINFLCNITAISISNRQKTKKKCLQGSQIYNLNSQSLSEHPWIKSQKNYTKRIETNSAVSNFKMSLREVIKIVRESFKTSLVEYNEKKYESILNKLEIILNNHFGNINEENVKQILVTKKNIIKKISLQIGVKFNDLFDKINNLVYEVYRKQSKRQELEH